MKIKPGDRIVIIQKASYDAGYGWIMLASPACTAKAISYDEYCAYWNSPSRHEWNINYPPPFVKRLMENEAEYPFRIESVGKLPQFGNNEINGCGVGSVIMLDESFFRRIDDQGRLDQGKDFMPGDDVLVLNDVVKTLDDGMSYLVALAGSRATVMPREQYLDHFSSDQKHPYAETPEQVAEWVEQNMKFPVQFHTVDYSKKPHEAIACYRWSVAVVDKSNLHLVSSPFREIEGKMR